MKPKYRVTRAIAGADGKYLVAGEIVDAAEWRNLRTLIATGRLEVVKDAPAKADATAPSAPAVKKATKKVVAETPAVETDDEA